jgi:hypothetical protein
MAPYGFLSKAKALRNCGRRRQPYRRETLNWFEMETRLDDNKIQHHQCHWLECTRAPCEELALPKSVESGNLGLNICHREKAASQVSTAAVSHRLPRK